MLCCVHFPPQGAKFSLGAKINVDSLGWECVGRAFPRHIWSSLCRVFRLARYQSVERTALPSQSQEQCLVGAGTSLVSWVLMTPMVGPGQNRKRFWGSTWALGCSWLSHCLFADRHFPSLLKSLRSQRVTYISCGEDHTAALTKLSCELCYYRWYMCYRWY